VIFFENYLFSTEKGVIKGIQIIGYL